VGAGFLGGAALGAAGTIATMGVYHRYMQYRLLYGGLGYNPWYYNNYYYNNHCWGGCPPFSHCEWGFCECDRGFYKRWGRCASDYNSISPRPTNFDPFVACGDNGECQKIDNNMICNTNVTIQQGGKCECRQDMRWNTNDQECQLYLDVDCSSITYDKTPSPVVLAAVNKTLENVEGKNLTAEFTDDGTKLANQTVSPSPNVTLENSLLSSIDPKAASKEEIKEAFCRDVDSFSWEFGNPQRLTSGSGSGASTAGSIAGIVVGIIAISFLCICCCICCVCKGAKDKISKAFRSDHKTEQEGGVTFSNLQAPGGGDQNYPPPSYPPQPQPGYPPASNYGSQPPVIPPTQPGYTNYPPEYNTNNQPPYPPSYQQSPYQAPYPPTNNQAPYPPTNNQMPYPPGNPY